MNEESTREETVSAEPQTKKSNRGKFFASGALVVVIFVGIVALAAVFFGIRNLSSQPAVVQFARVMGISIAKINGIPISYADYMEDMTLLRKFYEGQIALGMPPLAEEEISDQVLSRLAINALIMDHAEKYGVSVSKEEVANSPMLAQLVAPFGTREAAEAEMQKRYGLTFDLYVAKVVTPVMLEQKLQEAFAAGDSDEGKPYEEEQARARHILFQVVDPKEDATVKKEAQTVLERIKGGEDFATLAQEFGSDGTKDQGGDLGWFGRGRMVPAFESAVFAAQAGTLISELVKTEFGYHIVKVEDKRTGRNYSAFMGDQLRLAQVEILNPKVHNPFSVSAIEETTSLPSADTSGS